MIAMRYSIALPRDYDMAVIRHRIAERGHALDEYDGLVLKASCLSEAGVAGATENVYAPFYVWANTSRMSRFLWGGDGFEGIERDFGRPRVDVWPIASLHLNAAGAKGATTAVLTRTAATPAETWADAADRLRTEANAAALRKDARAAARAIDTTTGDVIGFDLLTAAPRRTTGTVYEVAHVSAPARG